MAGLKKQPRDVVAGNVMEKPLNSTEMQQNVLISIRMKS